MRIMVVKGKTILMGGAAILLAAAVFFLCFGGVNALFVSANTKYRPIQAVATDSKVYAITLDGEQNSYNLGAFVSFLGRYEAPASVFITGNYAREYARDLDVFHKSGHVIQSLGKKGDDLGKMSIQNLTGDVKESGTLIEKNCWSPPTLVRYLGKNMPEDSISALKSSGYTVVGAGIDRDSYNLEEVALGERMAKDLKNGAIVRFSLDIKEDVAAMDRFIAIAEKNGYSPIPLEKLLLQGEYVVDGNGVQRPVQ